MRPLPALLALAALAPLVGCATAEKSPSPVQPDGAAAPRPEMQVAPGWRRFATQTDRERLVRSRAAWTEALAEARAAGHAARITSLGALADPDAAMPGPEPAPGRYRCRTIKLGAQGAGNLPYVAYGWFRCGIVREDDHLVFVKESGSQRPSGRLWHDTADRMIFLGTMMLGQEPAAYAYGTDEERDMIGIFERIGEQRWRMVLPWPHWESKLDLMEVVPAS